MPKAPWHQLQAVLLDYIRDRVPEEALTTEPNGDFILETCYLADEINVTDLAKGLGKALTILVD